MGKAMKQLKKLGGMKGLGSLLGGGLGGMGGLGGGGAGGMPGLGGGGSPKLPADLQNFLKNK
jgi:signal recognition particle subunit SRP54